MLQLNFAGSLGFIALVLVGVLVAKILFQPAQDRVAKSLLLGLLLGFAALITNQLYVVTGVYLSYPHYSYSTVPLMFSIGPFLYTYVQRLAHGVAPWQLRWWPLHWILPVCLTIAFVPYYWQSAEIKSQFIQSSSSRYFTGTLYLTNYAQIILYLGLCRKPLRQFKLMLLNNFSQLKRINLIWLTLICWGLFSLSVLDVFLPLLGIVSTDLYYTFLIANSFFIVLVAYLALGHSALQLPLVVGEPNNAGENIEEKSELSKYSRSGLREDSAQYLVSKLQMLMEEGQLYLNEELTLQVLADALKASPHHLSQVLNEHEQKTFYDYINELRINHAKSLLLKDQQRPIIEIAYASGYNNKVSFYNSFKRLEGKTPSKYRSDHLRFKPKRNLLPKG